ncbi:hypothetical protein GCM10022419_078710 [Nonomuraea rosea]|uniref:Uncharacterized protein n=1 Tax=Nonomuraea rosea TaxID=638574 RepID=A0ABP6YPD4_9ACTN
MFSRPVTDASNALGSHRHGELRFFRKPQCTAAPLLTSVLRMGSGSWWLGRILRGMRLLERESSLAALTEYAAEARGQAIELGLI